MRQEQRERPELLHQVEDNPIILQMERELAEQHRALEEALRRNEASHRSVRYSNIFETEGEARLAWAVLQLRLHPDHPQPFPEDLPPPPNRAVIASLWRRILQLEVHVGRLEGRKPQENINVKGLEI